MALHTGLKTMKNNVDKKVLNEALKDCCVFWEKQTQDRNLEVHMSYNIFMGWIINLLHKGKRVCYISLLKKEDIITIINNRFKGWKINYNIN